VRRDLRTRDAIYFLCTWNGIPFGLVYEYMDNLDLRQHLKNEPNVGRLELVLAPSPLPITI
jgi:hypothetical protein